MLCGAIGFFKMPLGFMWCYVMFEELHVHVSINVETWWLIFLSMLNSMVVLQTTHLGFHSINMVYSLSKIWLQWFLFAKNFKVVNNVYHILTWFDFVSHLCARKINFKSSIILQVLGFACEIWWFIYLFNLIFSIVICTCKSIKNFVITLNTRICTKKKTPKNNEKKKIETFTWKTSCTIPK